MSDDVVRTGKYVSLTYTIVDDKGEVVEQHDLPVGYVHGSDTQLIGDMDKAITGHRVGDMVQLTVPPEQGFGDRDESLTFTDDLDNVPPEFRRIGAEVVMENDRGESRTFYVTRIADGKLTVDGNHPLAGQQLKINVKIHEVRDAKPGEDKVSGIHAVNMPGPTSIN
jgi:FKBP-type peptidyl-prolyl cis-trans isomerase SlyD